MEYQYKESLLPQHEDYSALEAVFARRGIAIEDIAHYLHTTDEDILSTA